MSNPETDIQQKKASASAIESLSNNKAVIIGLYGLPGSGKTTLLKQLKQELQNEQFAFYESFKMIDSVTPGGLDAFQTLGEAEKVKWRQVAIDAIKTESIHHGQVAIVTGHFMFWRETQEEGCPVYTQNDLDTFTHMLYLDCPAEQITLRRQNDTEKIRPSESVAHLHRWQQAEKTQLRQLCPQHRILFSLVSQSKSLDTILTLLRDFRKHTEKSNLALAEGRPDKALTGGQGELETVLVMDGDQTLAAEDTGMLFWKKSSEVKTRDDQYTLKTLFSSSLGYSYTAFRQATLLYEETTDDKEFDILCQDVASEITMHPQFVSMLRLAEKQKHIGAIIVSCGLKLVWEKVLAKEGLSETVTVIGGGRIQDGFVVSPAVKGALVSRLRNFHQVYVWAFGDSPMDLDMLSKADQAVVVVGEEHTRSTTMDAVLAKAVQQDGLLARQTLLPSNASPRLDSIKLPIIDLMDHEFLDSVLRRRDRRPHLQVLHATKKNAAKLLMTPTRDATFAGPALREAHHRVGQYLAIEYAADLIGVEEYPIPHVQGHHVDGYRLSNERQTSIVALMRGGEPMALGINDAFPLATFMHAHQPHDIKLHHKQDQQTAILVDSVVNSGKNVVQFVDHIHKLRASIRIVVVAGVVQAQSVSEGSLIQTFTRTSQLTIVALRLSYNKYTGTGNIDTGNRLFNTTHLIDS